MILERQNPDPRLTKLHDLRTREQFIMRTILKLGQAVMEVDPASSGFGLFEYLLRRFVIRRLHQQVDIAERPQSGFRIIAGYGPTLDQNCIDAGLFQESMDGLYLLTAHCDLERLETVCLMQELRWRGGAQFCVANAPPRQRLRSRAEKQRRDFIEIFG